MNSNPTSLAWGQPHGAEQSLGIIAAGDSSGNLTIWDASKIINKKCKESAVQDSIVESKIFNDNVGITCIDFNPIIKSNIAFSGSEVRVVSLNKGESFNFKGTESKISYTSVKWNKKVHNILASTNDQAVVNVWDLKTKKSIFTIQAAEVYDPFTPDKSLNKNISIAWNPEKVTQIAVATEDDESPLINVWELRNLSAPLMQFKGVHKKGIKGIAWSDQEPSYFLTVSKDCTSILWDYKQATAAYEISLASSANTVQFIPIHSHYVAASSEGDMELMYISHPMKCLNNEYESKPFVWKKKKCFGRFGFGGKHMALTGNKMLNERNDLNRCPEFVENAKIFEEVMSNTSNHLSKFIDKCNGSLDKQDILQFQLMGAVQAQNKEEILKLLGIDKQK